MEVYFDTTISTYLLHEIAQFYPILKSVILRNQSRRLLRKPYIMSPAIDLTPVFCFI